MNDKIIISVVIGIIVGLVLGIVLTAIIILPTITPIAQSNQVLVSGTVYETQFGKIEFTSDSANVSTSVLIADGKYQVVLKGGYSYDIAISMSAASSYADWHYSLYVPSGVAMYTGNF